MPVPVPHEGEDKDKFIGRCMVFMTNENKQKPDGDKMPQKQMVAICFTSWKDYSKAKAEMEKKHKKKRKDTQHDEPSKTY